MCHCDRVTLEVTRSGVRCRLDQVYDGYLNVSREITSRCNSTRGLDSRLSVKSWGVCGDVGNGGLVQCVRQHMI